VQQLAFALGIDRVDADIDDRTRAFLERARLADGTTFVPPQQRERSQEQQTADQRARQRLPDAFAPAGAGDFGVTVGHGHSPRGWRAI
jgi:hypothetical protein